MERGVCVVYIGRMRLIPLRRVPTILTPQDRVSPQPFAKPGPARSLRQWEPG